MTQEELQFFESVGEVMYSLHKAIADSICLNREDCIKLIDAKELVEPLFKKYFEIAKK